MQQAKLLEGIPTAQPAQLAMPVQPIGSFLEAALSFDTATQRQEATDVADGSWLLGTEPIPGGEAQKGVEEADMSHDVPRDVLVMWGHVLDIVTPDSCLTNCFTKTYTRFAKVCSVQFAAPFWRHLESWLLPQHCIIGISLSGFRVEPQFRVCATLSSCVRCWGQMLKVRVEEGAVHARLQQYQIAEAITASMHSICVAKSAHLA